MRGGAKDLRARREGETREGPGASPVMSLINVSQAGGVEVGSGICCG